MLKSLIISITGVIFSLSASAQMPPGYGRTMLDMNNQRMARMGMMRPSSSYSVNKKYTFTVVAKDSSFTDVYSKIFIDSATHKNYLVFVNKSVKKTDPAREQKIYPNQSIRISRKAGGFSEDILTGIPVDSCWLFKVVTGKINVYANFSERDDPDPASFRAFQVDDGQIVKLDKASLELVIKDNAKAAKFLEKDNIFAAIEQYNLDNKDMTK